MSEGFDDESREWINKEEHKPWHLEKFARKCNIKNSSYETTLYRILPLNPHIFLFELLCLKSHQQQQEHVSGQTKQS